MPMTRLRKDTEGAALVEFTIVMFFLFLFLGGLIDFMYVFWQSNMLIKAVERGARIAAVSDPVAGGPGGLNTAGLRMPAACNNTFGLVPYPLGAFDCVCSGGSGSCAAGPTGPCPAGYNAAAMNAIVNGRPATAGPYSLGMASIAPVTAANVIVRYYDTGLGFCGKTTGPVPTITVQIGGTLGGQTANPVTIPDIFLGGGFGMPGTNITLRTAQSSITGELLCTSAPCPVN